jgi:LacI family transcriptional regulator
MAAKRSIAVLVDTATSWGRGIIRGVRNYNNRENNWSLYLQPWGNYDSFVLPKTWSGDGVIARVSHQETADRLLELGCPVVNVSWTTFGSGVFSRCIPSPRTISKLAIQHFSELGLSHLAYVGCMVSRPGQVDALGVAFAGMLAKQDIEVHIHPQQTETACQNYWDLQVQETIAWLKSLPKPCGILCWDAIHARRIADASVSAGFHLPMEIAVLAGDYDEVMCTIADPAISSVELPGEQVGYQAAESLNRMLNGEPAPREPILVDPISITVRLSTDAVAVEDPLISQAIRFIRDRATMGISVKDILRTIPLSRRALEQGMIKYLQRSPAEEIRRIRLQHAQTLLLHSHDSMPEVAKACGFANADHLLRNFRREIGISPTDYRRKHFRR